MVAVVIVFIVEIVGLLVLLVVGDNIINHSLSIGLGSSLWLTLYAFEKGENGMAMSFGVLVFVAPLAIGLINAVLAFVIDRLRSKKEETI